MGQVSTPTIWHARGTKRQKGEESIKEGEGTEKGDRRKKGKLL